jgi:hypothetical protein
MKKVVYGRPALDHGRFGTVHVYQISNHRRARTLIKDGATWTFLLERQAQKRILLLFIATASKSSTLHSTQLTFRIEAILSIAVSPCTQQRIVSFPVSLSCRAVLTSKPPLVSTGRPRRGRRRANPSHS